MSEISNKVKSHRYKFRWGDQIITQDVTLSEHLRILKSKNDGVHDILIGKYSVPKYQFLGNTEVLEEYKKITEQKAKIEKAKTAWSNYQDPTDVYDEEQAKLNSRIKAKKMSPQGYAILCDCGYWYPLIPNIDTCENCAKCKKQNEKDIEILRKKFNIDSNVDGKEFYKIVCRNIETKGFTK